MTENKKSSSPTKQTAVLFEQEGSIAIITLNRPARYNAVNDDLIDGLNAALNQVRNDENIRAVVLTGNGKGFCAGADMNAFDEITPEEGRAYIIATYGSLMRNFLTLRKPIIGAIHGSAAGVGCAMALACDLRVMAENSNFRYAFINIGLGPDGGAGWFLARQVGSFARTRTKYLSAISQASRDQNHRAR